MKVLSANINGIWNAIAHGFFDWLTWSSPDVVCLQELNSVSLPSPLLEWIHGNEYDIAASLAANGGTAILSRLGFESIVQADRMLASRGQITRCRITGIEIASVYVTLRNSAEERHSFDKHFEALGRHERAIIAGDFNIIAQPGVDSAIKYGSTAIGCGIGERQWLLELKARWDDVLPRCYSERPIFTWWSRRNKDELFYANRGTRLDYIFASPAMGKTIRPGSGLLYRELFHGKRITDHAPIAVEFD